MMYERLKTALQEKGEIMIQFDSGETGELHLHNTEFIDEPFVKVEGEDETHWFNAEKVERYWIHDHF